MRVADKLLLPAMGLTIVAAVTIIVLAWEVPEAPAKEEAGEEHGICLAHYFARFSSNPDGAPR